MKKVRTLTGLAAALITLIAAGVAEAQAYYVEDVAPLGGFQIQGVWATYEDAANAWIAAINTAAGQAVWGPLGSCVPSRTATQATSICSAYYVDQGLLCASHDVNGPDGNKCITAQTLPVGYWISYKPRGTCSKDCVNDPINPANGNVYHTEIDVSFSGPGAIAFQRFYNSVDSTGVDGVPGWRHSYARSIVTINQPIAGVFGHDPTGSAEFNNPADACTQGFGQIQGLVSAWKGATATYSGGSCVVSSASGVMLDTLVIYQTPYVVVAQPTVIEYDVIRDDGETLRFPVLGGVITNLPGVSLRLAQTASGFTVIDDQDTVEMYSSAGVLQSITTRAGIVQQMSYDSSGRWSGVSDSFGHALSVTRNAQESITTLAISGGGSVGYAYDSQARLSVVTNLDGTTRSYSYGDSSFANALTALTDESGTQLSSWNYDYQERGASTSEAGGADAGSLTYNGDGSVTWTDALGAVRTFDYTRVGDINQASSISGSQCPTCEEGAATAYDAAGFVSSRTDYNGNVTCYANDPVRGLELYRIEGFASGSTCPSNLANYTPAAGTTQRKISTTWSANFRVPTQIVEATRTSTFTLDGSGNVLTKTVTDTTVSPNVSRTWTYTYDSYGRMLTAKGPRTDVNSTTTYSYYTCTTGYQCGQLQSVTDAAGHVTTYSTYNASGQPLTITDANGVLTTLTYDARQRLTSRLTEGEQTGFSYYPTGLLKTLTMADGSTLAYTYDTAHRLTQIADGAGNLIGYTLDAMGNRTATTATDAGGVLSRTQSRVYNTLSELYQLVGSAGSTAVTTTFGYDGQGNQTSVNAPLARNTGNVFDALNRLSQITDPASGVTHIGYDAQDNVVSVQDPATLTTSYHYNGMGDLLQQISPATGTTTNTYDSAGNLATSSDARGKTATYSYDALNRVTQVAYGDQTIVYGYDAGTNGKGHLTGASDANHTMGWAYDALGRVVSKAQSVAGMTLTTGYAYTGGDLTTVTTPSGQSIVYGYANHQIHSIAVNGTTLLSGVGYESFGPPLGWSWGNGTSELRLHDTDGNPSQITGIESTSYHVDNAFRIVDITNAANASLSWTYGYDSLDRLTLANATGTALTWSYDADGNRLTQAGGGAPPVSLSTLTYNNRGRLISATTNLGAMNATYNALGQRIGKATPTTATLYSYDESGHLIGEYDGSGNLIEETVWMGDLPVATLRPKSGGGVNVFYIHADHLGSPKAITQPSNNALVWRWDQDAFALAAPNQNPAGLGSFVYNPRFPGQYYDQETGLNYNYERDYDPTVGRYVESDPIGLRGGSFSTYTYVDANPVGDVDPFGLAPPPSRTGGTSSAPSIWDFPTQQWNQSRDAEAIALQDAASNAIDSIVNAAKAAAHAVRNACLNAMSEQDKRKANCQALKQSILNTCAGLKGRKQFACFQAASDAYLQCMEGE